jgi:hypothetical protein
MAERQVASMYDLKTALRTCPAMRFSNGLEDGYASPFLSQFASQNKA